MNASTAAHLRAHPNAALSIVRRAAWVVWRAPAAAASWFVKVVIAATILFSVN
jgi:hypothetical protein